MIYQIGVAILFVTSVVAEDVTSLRGSVAAASKHIFSHAAAHGSQSAQEVAMRSFLQEATKQAIKINSDNHMESQSFGNTVESPNLSFEDYLVSRKWTQPGCHGEVESLMAMRVGCMSYFGEGSSYYRCGPQQEQQQGGDLLLEKKNSKPTMTMYMDAYASNDCSGEVVDRYQVFFPEGCQGDTGYQCVPHSRTPDFAAKESLTTYKFKNIADCQDFSNYALDHWAGTADDSVDFDDDFVPQQDDQLQFGSGEEDITPRRRTTTTTSAVTDKEVQEVAQHATTTTTSVGNKEVQEMADHMYFREYMVSQQRNGACAFDPKYQVWVKSNCHGKANRMVRMMFEDAECTRVMKRSVHRLDEAVPHYAQCVQSNSDSRAALTVCHNAHSDHQQLEGDWSGEGLPFPDNFAT